jgi:hypothetical protein
MTTKQVAKMLGVSEDSMRKYKGVFRYHQSYYYRHGMDGTTVRDRVLQKIPDAKILDYGDHYHSFVGGCKDGSDRDSFFWVKFTV